MSELVSWYRRLGHRRARLQAAVATGPCPEPPLGDRSLTEALEAVYCGAAAVELDEVETDPGQLWLAQRIEAGALLARPTPDERRRILARLVAVEAQETFLGGRFPGGKRFSLEGTDSLVPLLDALVEGLGADEVVIGTGHRGRLTLLVALGCLAREQLLSFFQRPDPDAGDVVHHLGGAARPGGVRVEIVPNPSHVEAVNPVVAGRVRARQDAGSAAAAVLLHGDGAFAGQGVVAETLNLARLDGYSVGGTVHVVVNNRVAFTTVERDARSSRYATDVARLLRVPVLHVDADEPELVVAAARLAAAYRAIHRDDIVLDLVGYRRRGHNEMDEPRFTLPVRYAEIDRRPTVRQRYAERLVADGLLDAGEAEVALQAERAAWKEALARAPAPPPCPPARRGARRSSGAR
jgi:2-oxoglutarate dehydrogenase E1 component